jgi:serine/threonine protein kinase
MDVATDEEEDKATDDEDKDKDTEYEEDDDLSASGHYRWARFHRPPFALESSNSSFGSVPRLKLPPLSTKPRPSPHQVLSSRAFHVTLADRPMIQGFEFIDVQNLGAFSRICSGSNCQIFSSTHRNRRVIIKSVLPEFLDNSVAMDEFNFEVELLARMAHPNICQAFGSGAVVGAIDKCVPFVVMEELRPLNTFFNMHGPLRAVVNFEQVLTLAKDLAGALHYLHEELFEDAMVIHRDLKPENMALDDAGNLKLIDFGLGRCIRKRTTSNEAYAMTGSTGTLRYMAPEVALSQPYTEKVDVYSFGVVVWTLATNCLFLHKCKKKQEFRDKVCIDQVRPTVPPTWPKSFQKLLHACWHQDSTQRPSFREVLVAIDATLLGMTVPQPQRTLHHDTLPTIGTSRTPQDASAKGESMKRQPGTPPST